MTEQEKRKNRCCFTGHRPEKIAGDEAHVKKKLQREIERAYEDGYRTFITGMSRGVDLWAAQSAMDLRKVFPDIRIIAAIPFEGFESKWPEEWKRLYHKMLKKVDLKVKLAEEYVPECYQRRNRWMVDHSSLLIAYYNGSSGGTRNTIQYALQAPISIRLFV